MKRPVFSLRTLILVLFFAAIGALIIRDRIDARPLAYEEYSKSRLKAHLDSGHSVLITLSANWDAATLNQLQRMSHNLTRQMRKHGVVAMYADFTAGALPVKELMSELKLNSVPAIVIYHPQNPVEPIVFPDLVTEQQILDAIK